MVLLAFSPESGHLLLPDAFICSTQAQQVAVILL
jgi:hypothetical protein